MNAAPHPAGLIKHKIATMAARCYGAESLAYALAANMDRWGAPRSRAVV